MRRSISRTFSRYSLEPGAVARPEAAPADRVDVLGDRVEDAAVVLHPRQALRRRCRRRPNIRSNTTRGLISIGSGVVGVCHEMRVHVGAAVAGVAAADVAGEVLGRQLERRERRVLADLLGDDLVDRDAGADVLGLGPLRRSRRSATPPTRDVAWPSTRVAQVADTTVS